MNKAETIANIKVLEEEMAHLMEHLEIINALRKQREAAYKRTNDAYYRLRWRYQQLDMKRALLSKSTIKVITNGHVGGRMKEEQKAMSMKQLNNNVDKMSKEQINELLNKLSAMVSAK